MKKKENLPKKISVFPLSNFIIFPNTSVPLNIFVYHSLHIFFAIHHFLSQPHLSQSQIRKDRLMSYIRKMGTKHQCLVRLKGHPNLSKSFVKFSDAQRWGLETELKIRREEMLIALDEAECGDYDRRKAKKEGDEYY